MMDQCEEDSEVLQLNEEEHLTSDRSVPPTGSMDQAEDKEQPTQGQEDDGGDEWDTDLETVSDDTKQKHSRAERYLKACRQLGVAPISSFLRNSSEANLNLNHYGVGPLGAKALAKALQYDRVVTNLELEDNALRAEGARYLTEMLQTNMSIQSLNLSNNQLHHDGADVIFKMLLDNCFVKSIKLSGNGFVDTAAKYFAEALKDDLLVTELDLSDNKFGESGGEHLGDMLAKNASIKVLNLSWNSLCMRGVVALSDGLKLNSTLKQLQLSWNRLGHVEAESLGQALKQNEKLELLDLSGNIIDNKAVTLLCHGLAKNGSLRVLRLSHNLLTNDGALTLLKTVTNNKESAVEELDISTVFVYEAFVELLEEARQRRPALDVRYSIMSDTARNLSALSVFKKFLNERNESIMDFCQALDKDGAMTVSTSDFRKAVKAPDLQPPRGPLRQATGMNSSIWSKAMYSSSNICPDGCTAEHLSSFRPDPIQSNSDVSGPPVTLHEDMESIKLLPESAYYSSSAAGSASIFSSQMELNASRDTGHLSTGRHPSPASSSCGHHDCGHQAKRARVENIIKGMTGSPGMHGSDVTINQHEESDGMQENERIQELPLHQERRGSGNASHSQMTRKLLQSQHQHLRQLRKRFSHVDGGTDTTDSSNEEKYPTWNNSPEISPRDACTDSYREFESSSSRKYQGWKKVKLMNYFQSKPERIKLMADVLKYELSRAVSMSVDSIFQSMPLLQTSANDEGKLRTDVPLQSSVCKDKKATLSCCGDAEVQLPDVQTEALSLVVQKPQPKRADKFILKSRLRAHQRPKPPIPFSYESAPHEEDPSEKNQNTTCQHALRCLQDGCSEVGQAKFETFDAHWNSVKVRSKVNSRSVRSPQTRTASMDPVLLQSMCLPHVKVESDSLVKNNLYILNEGLTTNHLKKAKLMFFYTRYPSSLVLKMCFHDVQFTRCITSQLIKWFSNFREFYYIQMEKFARHALIDGVADVRSLTVGRESELFRALNMHYNKANDFQVPDRFLEIAEITLREFYVAISVGKDRDPSWKKAIYKVICKLDSDVPAEFKNHHSG